MKKQFTIGIISMLALICTDKAISQADTWTQIIGDGFGTVNNESVGEFEVYNGFLYAGTKRKQGFPGAPQLWISSSGDIGSWIQITSFSPALSNGGNIVSFAQTTLPGNYFWLGTLNKITGAAVYRSGDGTSWTRINNLGFGNTDNTLITPHMVVYQGSSDTIPYLYAGTENDTTGAQLWRTPYTNSIAANWTQVMDFNVVDTAIKIITYLYVWNDTIYFGTAGSGGGKGQLWQSGDGVSFTQNMGVGNGFGDMGNYGITSMADFNNQLYVTTRHQSSGGEVWRTSDGNNWQQVTNNAFGAAGTLDELHNIRVSFNNIWVTGLSKTSGSTGCPVWRSTDGFNFVQSNVNGFGDSNNKGNAPVVIGFGNYEYYGGNNAVTGAQIWRAYTGAPVANFTGSDSVACEGANISFTNNSSFADSYDWQVDGVPFDTTANTSYIFSTAGTLTVTLIAYNDFSSDTTNILIDILNCAGITEPGNIAVDIFPNPSTGKFTLKNNSNEINYLEIQNALGEKIILNNYTIGLTENVIDLSSVPNGIYFMIIQTTNGSLIKKIIINK